MKNKNTLLRLAYQAAMIGMIMTVVSLPSFIAPVHAANALIGQETAVLDRTNNIRAAAGLPALTFDARLAQSAARKATDMATRGYFDHANPDGLRMSYWINSTGYTYTLAGENLAKGFSDLSRLMNAWVASPTHYKNLVEPKFTNIGIGMAEGWYEDQPTLFIVQHFGVEATQIAKDIAPAVAVLSPLVETVAGASDEQTLVNSGPSSQLTDQIAVSPRSVTQQPTIGIPSLIEVAQASPSDTNSDPITSPNQFWPIFALIALSLMGYLDEFAPLWSSIYLKK